MKRFTDFFSKRILSLASSVDNIFKGNIRNSLIYLNYWPTNKTKSREDSQKPPQKQINRALIETNQQKDPTHPKLALLILNLSLLWLKDPETLITSLFKAKASRSRKSFPISELPMLSDWPQRGTIS